MSKAAMDGTVISPEQKKPKKHAVAAAHIMRVLWVTSDLLPQLLYGGKGCKGDQQPNPWGHVGLRALIPARSSFSWGRVDVS